MIEYHFCEQTLRPVKASERWLNFLLAEDPVEAPAGLSGANDAAT